MLHLHWLYQSLCDKDSIVGEHVVDICTYTPPQCKRRKRTVRWCKQWHYCTFKNKGTKVLFHAHNLEVDNMIFTFYYLFIYNIRMTRCNEPLLLIQAKPMLLIDGSIFLSTHGYFKPLLRRKTKSRSSMSCSLITLCDQITFEIIHYLNFFAN